MSNSFSASVLTFLIFFSSHIYAKDIYAGLRSEFLQAEKEMPTLSSAQQQILLDKFRDYPLLPYLQLAQIKKQNILFDEAEKNNFMERYPSSHLSEELNKLWLDQQFENKNWQAYINAYQQQPAFGATYQCQQALALLATGNKQQAMQSAQQLWLVGHSQVKTCDPLFKQWIETGNPSSSTALKRFWMAISERNIHLARYLERFIKDDKHKKQTALFWKIHKTPSAVAELHRRQLRNDIFNTVLIHGYKRFSRSTPEKAATAWLKQRGKISASIPLRATIDQLIASRLANHNDEKSEKLIRLLDPKYRYPAITEKLLRQSLAEQNWEKVALLIGKLPREEQANSRWLYWKAQTEFHLNGDKEQLISELKKIANERTFYGFLSAEQSSQPFQLSDASIQPDQSSLDELMTLPEMQRIYELFKLDKILDANKEWNRFRPSLTPDQQIIAAYLTDQWGWHTQAIQLAISLRHWNHLSIRFPNAYLDEFEKQSKVRDIDPTWAVAIARQESAFNEQAISPAGARGVMQLMPATARATAKKHKIPYSGTNQLFQSEKNITLGTAYLSEMYSRHKQMRAYATAAYNAGPNRVSRWLKERGDLPLDLWIETIPFKETRNYVQNVLSFRVIYDQMAGRTPSLLSEQEQKTLALLQTKKQ